METSLGRGYSINEDFAITDFYSPPSSVIDDIDEPEEDSFYPEDGEQDEQLCIVPDPETNLPDSFLEHINTLTLNADLSTSKSSASKLIPTGTTPPPTPQNPYRLFLPTSSLASSTTTTTSTATMANFQSTTINNQLPISSSRNNDTLLRTWPLADSTNEIRSNNLLFPRPMENSLKTASSTNHSSLMSSACIGRYFTDHRQLSDTNSRPPTTLDLPLPMLSSPLSSNRQASASNVHSEIGNEISRLCSYMSPVDEIAPSMRTPTNSWSISDDSLSTFPIQSRFNHNSFGPQMNLNSSWLPRNNSYLPNIPSSMNQSSSYQHQQVQQQTSPTSSMINPLQSQNTWLLSEMSAMLRQNQQQQSMVTFNSNITLSTTAQQILAANVNGNNNNNNRPLRSEKIDIEIIKHLIREAKWKRQCGLKKEVCVFCRNNGENELIYSSHSLKDPSGNVTCPILRAYQCPICGATGAQAHTIKYCQATGDDNNQHIPTPYERMIRTQCMQTFGLDDSLTSNMPTLFDPLPSPSSLYTNGWSNSYL